MFGGILVEPTSVVVHIQSLLGLDISFGKEYYPHASLVQESERLHI